MMQKNVEMSVPRINAKTGERGGKRMPSAEPSASVLTIAKAPVLRPDVLLGWCT